MAEYLTTDTELQTVANAIRTKTGTSASLTYPDGFATAIANIASDCDATAEDIMTGKTALVGNTKIVGNISGKSAETFNTSTSDRTIAGAQYLSGAQTIKAVTTSNISAGNIKNGVTVTVGDANSAGRIANVTGTFASDATVAAGDMLSGKIGYNGASKITGNIPSKAAATYNTSTSDQTIAAGQYLSGAQTIKGVTTANISAGNIKSGVVVKVGDTGNAGRIANVTGTFTSDGTVAAGSMLSGKTAYANGSKITGNIASLGATTYNMATSDQTIAAGKYLSGAQTIRKITTSNISAGNIKKGVTIQVGDSGSATRIANVTGTCVECGIPNNLDVFPIMWNSGTNWSSWAYHSDTTSSYAAERTVGLKGNVGLVTSSIRSFSVPCRMTWTYYSIWHTNSTSTITLEPGRWYYLRGKDSSDSTNYCIYDDYGGTTKLTDFYKLVSWVYA